MMWQNYFASKNYFCHGKTNRQKPANTDSMAALILVLTKL